MKLKSLFSLLGFEIYRKSKKNKIKFDSSQKPLYIEFLGVSGVGKSTIFNALQKKEKFWLTVNEHNNSLGKHQRVKFDKNSAEQRLAEQRWKYLKEKNYLPTDKLRVAYWNYVILNSDALLQKNNKNSIVLSDEGMVLSFSDAIMDLENENSKLLDDFLKNRAFVYCTARPDVILKRIESRRKQTGKVVAQHKTNSNQELLEIISQETKERDNLVDFLKRRNKPLLVIDTSEELDKNLSKVLTFIREFQHKENINT